jgi:glutathione peroxidase
MASATEFYDFSPNNNKGEPYNFSQLKGKVVLIVNTASKCGFTPQLADLQKLYTELRERDGGRDDFEIIAFPCNQFGNQDPGTDAEIMSFCQVNYGVTFPVLAKIDVNGKNEHPIYTWLKKEKPGFMGLKMIKWNFEKFLVGRDGQVKERWASTSKPESLKAAIEKELAAKVG